MEGDKSVRKSSARITLPTPDGSYSIFTLVESPILSGDMQTAHPDIRSYRVVSLDQRLSGRITTGANGLNALIYSHSDSYFIEGRGPKEHYIYKGGQEKQPFDCGAAHDHNTHAKKETKSISNLNNSGTLRTYVIAIATTKEYEDYFSGNTSTINSDINTKLSNLSALYEKELGVRFTLFSGNNTLINRGDTANDESELSQGNPVGSAMSVINSLINENLVDLGHVFHHLNVGTCGYSASGVAYLGVLCDPSFKTGAWTGATIGVSASWCPFDFQQLFLDIFAHEVGHQFGASHIFNGSGNNCGVGNHSANSAYEIGSGSSIMSYNGSCGSGQNIGGDGPQNNYFNTKNLEHMLSTMTSTSCATTTSQSNTAPTVDATPNNSTYTIPRSTPFILEGRAFDNEQDNLTYCWEQIDEDGAGIRPTHGKTGSSAAADARAPLFRSYPPTNDRHRVFPQLPDILAGNNTNRTFEALPSVARTMNFALTVRDNHTTAGAIRSDDIAISVNGSSGPFYINDGSISGNSFNITWNVAGTNSYCSHVDILYSDNGGESFNYILKENTANDGSESVSIANLSTSQGRVMVRGHDNIFFDINNTNRSVSSSCTANGGTIAGSPDISADAGASDLNLSLTRSGNSSSHSYTYIAIGSDNSIAQIDPTASFSDLVGGDVYYRIFGLSYSSSHLSTIQSAGTLSALSNLIFSGTVCAALSDNHIILNVTGAAYSCDDGIKNGNETDIDCGGPDCDACVYGCTDPGAHNYNSNANIENGTCQTCDDGIMNGDELAIDCGGAKCRPCITGCTDPSAHNYRPDADISGTCQTCSDGIKNGDELQVDCGGSNCSDCDCTETAAMTYSADILADLITITSGTFIKTLSTMKIDNSAKVTWQALNYVELSPGFSVESGELTISVDNCIEGH